jgi:tRNA-modifying protein YgfZ
MIGYLELAATEDALLAHAEPELRSIAAELERYVFATQVEIADVTEEMGLVLVAGPSFDDAARASGALVHPTNALGESASYLWVERPRVDDVVRDLEERGLRRAAEPELEAVRIPNGVPRWGRDMTTRTLPQEAGIDRLAVHYDKGCYLGQEAMAKIHFRGRVNRRLRRLSSPSSLERGAEVLLDRKRVGTVTSATDGSALAMLSRAVESGSGVEAGGVAATVVD